MSTCKLWKSCFSPKVFPLILASVDGSGQQQIYCGVCIMLIFYFTLLFQACLLKFYYMIISRSIHVAANYSKFSYGWVIFHYTHTHPLPHSFFISIPLVMVRLLPCLGYFKQYFCEYWGACIFSTWEFSLGWVPVLPLSKQ